MKQKDSIQQINFSNHALKRMSQRGISQKQVLTTIKFGKMYHTKGAICFVMGKRQVAKYIETQGIVDDALEGIHVVASAKTNGLTILTVYKNKNIRAVKRRSEKKHHKESKINI